jgi:hypothetical protein
MKKKIQFLTTQTVEAQGEIVKTFNAGEVYELELSSAKRWLRRNVATEVLAEAPKKRGPKPAPKPVVEQKFTRKPPVTSSAPESTDSDTGGRPEPDAK